MQHEDFGLPVSVRPMQRKTATLIIKQGCLEVRVPQHYTANQVQQILQQKRRWILRQAKAEQQRLQLQAPRHYQSGTLLFYLGDAKSLKLALGPACIECHDATVLLQAPHQHLLDDQAYLKAQLYAWFRQATLDLVQQCCATWSAVMGHRPRQVRVRRYRARWGCCHANGDLTFHDLLSMAPHAVVTYVVIHELAHLKHMNHSPAFWQWVATHQPDYQTQVAWLRTHHYRLAI